MLEEFSAVGYIISSWRKRYGIARISAFLHLYHSFAKKLESDNSLRAFHLVNCSLIDDTLSLLHVHTVLQGPSYRY